MSCKTCAIITTVVVLLVALIVLLSISFVGVHFYEFGFLKTKSTGEIDASRVYTGGLYAVGPNYGFMTFPADAHFVSLDKLDVATADENSINVWVNFQYQLRQDELNLVREKYNTGYEAIITSTATETLKQITTRYTNRQFLLERDEIEERFKEALVAKLQSRCCSQCCSEGCEHTGYCHKNCIPSDRCTVAHMHEHVVILDVQLTDIDLPDSLREKYLSNILLNVEEEKTQLAKNVTVIEKETQIEVNEIRVDTTEIRKVAFAEAELVRENARADARLLIEEARIEGLQKLFESAGFNQDKDRNIVNYMRALKEMGNARLNIDFDTLFRQN